VDGSTLWSSPHLLGGRGEPPEVEAAHQEGDADDVLSTAQKHVPDTLPGAGPKGQVAVLLCDFVGCRPSTPHRSGRNSSTRSQTSGLRCRFQTDIKMSCPFLIGYGPAVVLQGRADEHRGGCGTQAPWPSLVTRVVYRRRDRSSTGHGGGPPAARRSTTSPPAVSASAAGFCTPQQQHHPGTAAQVGTPPYASHNHGREGALLSEVECVSLGVRVSVWASE